jgi:acyl-CoA synthetase (AMP-forming)/AMP-acid ligase II
LNLGGDKVSPRTIEDALRAFYGIRDAAAFSVANGLGIDEVWALVVPNGRLNEEALQKHCRERLAQTHVPVRFINVADIPRNANGKVDRGRLNARCRDSRHRLPERVAIWSANSRSGSRLRRNERILATALKNGTSVLTCVVHTVEAACAGC